ncbi:hypothetical protein IscW_ISCW017897 [Ixodes scapularis]|uniref:Uncharacterized protein n=1 Tax=Ixodes scapularis TaxID=6945 RepID=B7PIZ6_IXOSC|nr:hypothetical protein IscW_ISCW017897 [Ixodes scapularis]|eukprot:XP_002406625.1 hypothetical protein IscW_ISCW017897 [Ixodes scapularis]
MANVDYGYGTIARVCLVARCPAPRQLRGRPLPCHPGLFKATQLRLRSQGSGAEAAWARALTADPGDPAEAGGGGSPTWPILAFLAFVLGAPWLLWRIFSAASKRAGAASQWASGAGDHFVAVAQFSFRPENSTELAVKAGQQLRLAPKGEWSVATGRTWMDGR